MLQTTHQQLLNNPLLVATSTSSEAQLSGVTNSSMSFIFNGVIGTGKGEIWVSNLERYRAQKRSTGTNYINKLLQHKQCGQ